MASDPFGRIPDIARYLLLWHYGGVYIDTDFEPLRPMDELLEDPRPFAAWENDRTMCTALLASPAKHPAIGVLLEGLLERLHETEGKSANEAVGPEYATALWRQREDVRRLPPLSFYPVGWWEKGLLGKIDYPAETYAVHHWAKGWGKGAAPTTVRKGSSGTSILVPFRDSDGSRTHLWKFVRERLERLYPEAEIIVASDDDEDPFHKTLAMNRAAEAATGDIFILFDADTWVDVESFRVTVDAVRANPMRWAQPYRQKVKLNEAATEAILAAGPDWDGTIAWREYGRMEGHTTFNAAPPLVVSRQAWDTVHGMDERFRGWSSEDKAFAQALTVMCGPHLPQPRVEALHLCHNRVGIAGNDLWPGQDIEGKQRNLALQARYRQARTPDAMRALLEEGYGGRGLHDGDGDRANTDRIHTVGVR